jgi:ketosteroid isomerase-like protein
MSALPRSDALRRATRAALALLILAAGAARAVRAQQAPLTPEDTVRAAESARRAALLAGDTVALSRLVADEFYEITRLGTIRGRADNMREIATGMLHLTTIAYDSQAVRIYGDVAVLRGIADNTGTFRGMDFTGRIRYLRVFVRRDGRWQAIAMQQTPMP